ncbi:LCP family protein [Pseudonocardia thermophila]|uniref:LCP family protein n=1 Tax=Pseudonocardia thermophila TaxID=1848 RepID=UPI00248DE0E4|nr:LCP family protein [Pseudonocardia thermophila]
MNARGPAAVQRPRTPGAIPPPRRKRTWRQRIRIAAVTASVLVLASTGTAWGLYRDVTAGIVTTDVVRGDASDGAQNILLVGVDSRTDTRGNPLPDEVLRQLHAGPDTGVLNSDTIIVLHMPDGGGAAAAFSIPRDTYVDIPGYRTDKINAAYPAVTALTAQQLVKEGGRSRQEIDALSRQAGRQALVKAVEQLTGLSIDHYAEINLLGFANLTQAIGGVEVCLRAPTSDPLSGANFAAGRQTISGVDALAFVRQRHGLPQGDLSRVRRQQVFLAAVANKILSAGTLTDPARLSALIGVAQESLVIDSGWDLLAFAQQAANLAGGRLEFTTIPTEGTETIEVGSVVKVDRSKVREFVDRLVEDQERKAEEAVKATPPPPPPGPLTIIPSRYVVDVRNGSPMPGLATSVVNRMRDLGFIRGTTGNTEPTEKSVVLYTGADRKAAEEVAEQLGYIAVEASDRTVAGHLLVVIGADFDRSVIPQPADAAPDTTTPAPNAPITADGVPCID